MFAVSLFSLILLLFSLWKGKAMLLGWPWDRGAPSGLSPAPGLWSKAHGGCPARRKIQGGDPQPLGCHRRTPAQVKQCTLNQGREGRGRYLSGTLASFRLCALHLTDAIELLDYFLQPLHFQPLPPCILSSSTILGFHFCHWNLQVAVSK